MKVAIITHSSTFEARAHAIGEFFQRRGDEVTWYFSDFDHRTKKTVERSAPDHVYVHLAPFTRNLSIRRMRSIGRFAKDVERQLDERMRTDPFDVLWFLLPANSLAPAADRLHTRYGVPIVFDIIDLWPESLPVKGLAHTLPARLWGRLRDAHLGSACLITTECDRYRSVIGLPADHTRTLYWYKDRPHGDPGTLGLDPGAAWRTVGSDTAAPIPVAYLGAVNNIIDIALITQLLTAMNAIRPVHLNIVGTGESLERFVEQARDAVSRVTYHGAVYDDVRKSAILGSCAYGLNIMKPTVKVGLSMKSIDYLYCGLPLLNAIGGDSTEFVEREGIGVQIDPSDIEGTARRAVAIATDPTAADRMHRAARACYEAHFTQECFDAALEGAVTQFVIPALQGEAPLPQTEFSQSTPAQSTPSEGADA
ncbi:MAG: glycosyltransferase [Bifidobacteriaceae bacterium]|nr:glycosyltransferase [Bifidobacteriaceae bacterium]